MHRFHTLRAAAMAAAAALAVPAAAQGIYPVGNDRGGSISARVSEIRAVDAAGLEVRIEGGICYSSCTMFLGARDVCVSPSTEFAFHGPSDRGVPLPADRFDHWSRVMAQFYREPIRSWFLSEARFDIRGARYLSGSELIRQGYPAC